MRGAGGPQEGALLPDGAGLLPVPGPWTALTCPLASGAAAGRVCVSADGITCHVERFSFKDGFLGRCFADL